MRDWENMYSEMQMVFAGVFTEQARPFLRTKNSLRVGSDDSAPRL